MPIRSATLGGVKTLIPILVFTPGGIASCMRAISSMSFSLMPSANRDGFQDGKYSSHKKAGEGLLSFYVFTDAENALPPGHDDFAEVPKFLQHTNGLLKLPH